VLSATLVPKTATVKNLVRNIIEDGEVD
jgi:hypothetical protein